MTWDITSIGPHMHVHIHNYANMILCATCYKRPPVLSDCFCLAGGVITQDRFYYVCVCIYVCMCIYIYIYIYSKIYVYKTIKLSPGHLTLTEFPEFHNCFGCSFDRQLTRVKIISWCSPIQHVTLLVQSWN